MLPVSLRTLSLDAPSLFLDILKLPRPLAFAIFAYLPVDTRLRCCEVNRAWRALLANTSFWKHLNLSLSSGLIRFSLPLLRAAVAKAGGQFLALDITGQRQESLRPLVCLLLEIVAANTATLTELRLDTGQYWSEKDIRALLELRGPAIQLLDASVKVSKTLQVARAVLRNEPPFQALHMRHMFLDRRFDSSADVVAFGSDLRCHASLEALNLCGGPLDTAAATGAVMDACIALCLRRLHLTGCRLVPVAVPELTRLIAAGMLLQLEIDNNNVKLFTSGMNPRGCLSPLSGRRP